MVAATRRHLTFDLALLFCALIFLVDTVTPRGVGEGFGYIALVAYVAWSGHRRFTLFLAALSTLLIVIGFFVSPPESSPLVGPVNRIAAIVLVWGGALLISDRRQLLSRVQQQAERLAVANEQLAQRAQELTTTNALLQHEAEDLAAANELLHRQAQQLDHQAARLQAQNRELQAMSDRLVAVQENERRMVSRELHDETGQVLTALSIQLGLLHAAWDQGENPTGRIRELKEMVNQLAEGLHRLAVNLRPASLDRAGLVAAVRQYAESYQKTYGLRVELSFDASDAERLAPEIESSLYRIIQEAFTNVARHAHASYVGLVLHQRPDAVVVAIEDDGVGFDVEEARCAGRLGLSGMQERAELRGGHVTIESRPGAGTTVFVEIPRAPHSVPAPTTEQPTALPS
jgi:signal transduction histidine kinase